MCWLPLLCLISTTARRVARPDVLITPLFTLCIASLLPTPVAAATNTWLGASNLLLSWNDFNNWSFGTVADGSSDILIAQGGVVGDFSFTNLHSFNLNAPAELFIQPTTTITNADGGLIVLGGTITGTGTLVNSGGIAVGSGQGVLAVNVTQTATGMMAGLLGSTLVLDGAHVTGGALFGRLAAQNGAAVKDLAFGSGGGQGNFVLLTGGSTLGLQGTVTVASSASLELGSGGAGATIIGTGTLVNQGSIFSGSIFDPVGNQSVLRVNVTQTANGGMAGLFGSTLVLDGAHVTGGFLLGQFAAQNGATVKDLAFGRGGGGGLVADGVLLTGGSTLGLQGTVTVADNAFLQLGSGGAGATIIGTGTLVNQGQISLDGLGNRGVLGVNVTQTANGFMGGLTGATLVLDGAHVTGGFLFGQFAAQNGATVKDLVFVGPTPLHDFGPVTLTGGSTLGMQGTVTNDAILNLGSSGLGATLNGVSGGTLVNNLVIVGAGTLNLPVMNNGILETGFDGALVLRGNVGGNGTVAANPGGTLILDNVTVQAHAVIVDGTLKGNGTIIGNLFNNNSGTVSPGSSPGLLTIAGDYQQSGGTLLIELGGLLAGTQYDVLDISGEARLSGLLDVDLFGGFDPTANAFFDVLFASDMIGTFDTVDLPTSTHGVFSLEYLPPIPFLGPATVRVLFEASSPGGQVPEPSSLALVLCGLAVVYLVRPRLQKSIH